MKKDSKRSKCWNFFEKVERGGKCHECKKVIAVRGNTSNLVKHLRNVHKKSLDSAVPPILRKRKDSSDYEDYEGEGVAPEEEPGNTVDEANAAVHILQAYKLNGETVYYLQAAGEGATPVQVQSIPFQPVVASSESISANGEIVSVAVQKDASIHEAQVEAGDAKTPEEAGSRRVVHAPVKNHHGSSLGSRGVVRQVNRPSPFKPPLSSSSNNADKEDPCEAFGRYVASMLRTLSPKTACKLQGEIVNWILKEQIKNNDS